MTRKRKRSHKEVKAPEAPRKRVRLDAGLGSTWVLPEDNASVKHPLLSLYYPQVLTLRNFLLSRLPFSSKSRRRRIESAGAHHDTSDGVAASEDQSNTQRLEDDRALAKLLDATLVGQPDGQSTDRGDCRVRELATFSQKATSTVGSSAGSGTRSQFEACTPFIGDQHCEDLFLRNLGKGVRWRSLSELWRLAFPGQCPSQSWKL